VRKGGRGGRGEKKTEEKGRGSKGGRGREEEGRGGKEEEVEEGKKGTQCLLFILTPV
jgi:hypothetical protein